MRNKIESYIYKNRTNIINSLMELVKIPSVVEEGDDDYPCGKSCGASYARYIPGTYAIGTSLVPEQECLDIEGYLKAIALLALTIYKLDITLC